MTLRDRPAACGYKRLLDGQLGFAAVPPDSSPAGFPGYWIWHDELFRNGELWGFVYRYWFDRDVLGWWVEYRR